MSSLFSSDTPSGGLWSRLGDGSVRYYYCIFKWGLSVHRVRAFVEVHPLVTPVAG